MRIPYGYQMKDNEFIICQEKAEVVRMIFNYYLSGASLGKVVDMLSEKRILSPTEKERWTRAAIDKLLSNAKYIPIVGTEAYMNVQFEKSIDAISTTTRPAAPERLLGINLRHYDFVSHYLIPIFCVILK